MTTDMFRLSWSSSGPSCMPCHRFCDKTISTDATREAGTVYLSGAPAFTSGFNGARVVRSLVFCVVFCRSLFVLLTNVLSFFLFLFYFTVSDYSLISLRYVIVLIDVFRCSQEQFCSRCWSVRHLHDLNFGIVMTWRCDSFVFSIYSLHSVCWEEFLVDFMFYICCLPVPILFVWLFPLIANYGQIIRAGREKIQLIYPDYIHKIHLMYFQHLLL
jgi:hypothetical protein